MSRLPKSATSWVWALTLALFASSLGFVPVRADVAPPESPPGANIVPGAETTQVRMLAERVTLTVLSSSANGHLGQAKTEASFLMRNLGTNPEDIEVRFPLTFFEQGGDGFGRFPEISDFQVLVNGKPVATRRIESGFSSGGIARGQSPWAAFNVKFPPGVDVPISVNYTADGFGYEPFVAFRYILETGAGWKDTIGTAEIVVKLPYPANSQNVLFNETTGFSETSPGAQVSGNQVAWRFENLEPTAGNNITISLIAPSFWKRVLDERATTMKSPHDGEAWGRLGKACKEAIRYNKGYLRSDPGGVELYQEAVAAYEKSVELLPQDALWHYGFADLLWSHYLYNVYYTGGRDYAELSRAARELKISLEIDPKNEKALELAKWISGQLPWALSETDKGFDYLILTATPTFAPPTVALPTVSATPVQESTSTLAPAKPTGVATKPIPAETPVTTPASRIPFCGGMALLLPILAGVLFWVVSKN
jgi:hypothetical protein